MVVWMPDSTAAARPRLPAAALIHKVVVCCRLTKNAEPTTPARTAVVNPVFPVPSSGGLHLEADASAGAPNPWNERRLHPPHTVKAGKRGRQVTADGSTQLQSESLVMSCLRRIWAERRVRKEQLQNQ